MNPSYISLAFLLFMIPVVITGQLMPSINLHIASDREALIRQQAELELIKGLRNSKSFTELQDDLVELELPGLTVKAVSISVDGEYVLAELVYQYTGLMTTKFFEQSRSKTVKVSAVRLD